MEEGSGSTTSQSSSPRLLPTPNCAECSRGLKERRLQPPLPASHLLLPRVNPLLEMTPNLFQMGDNFPQDSGPNLLSPWPSVPHPSRLSVSGSPQRPHGILNTAVRLLRVPFCFNVCGCRGEVPAPCCSTRFISWASAPPKMSLPLQTPQILPASCSGQGELCPPLLVCSLVSWSRQRPGQWLSWRLS
jgi:hypothetical protein